MVFFTADLHINDTKTYESTRSKLFRSEVSFHNYLMQRWNSKVTDHDTVITIGDVGEPSDTTLDILSYLNGHKILVIGNHDEDNLDYLFDVFDSMMYFYSTQIGYTSVCCFHKPLLQTNVFRQGYDVFIHGHHHMYNEYTWRAGAYALKDTNKYNACLDLNNFEPCTLQELKYNKPYQLQFFEKEWFKL